MAVTAEQREREPESANRPTTASNWLRAICHGLRSCGLELDGILEQAGIDTGELHDPEARIEAAKITELWTLCRERTGREDIGLVVAGTVQPGNLQSLGFALFTSSCLDDFLMRSKKYYSVVTDAASLDIEHMPGGTWIRYLKAPNALWLADEAVDAAIATIIIWLRYVITASYAPERICLQRRAPACADVYEQFFGCPVEFGADRTAILIHPETFRQPFHNANPELCAVHDALLDQRLLEVGTTTLEHEVRRQLATLLPAGGFSQQKLAAAMNMSVSTLYRRLKAERLSYSALLDEVRRDLALYYLGRTSESISEIAYHLGFSDSSNFSHAFQRWFQSTPRAYRKAASENPVAAEQRFKAACRGKTTIPHINGID